MQPGDDGQRPVRGPLAALPAGRGHLRAVDGGCHARRADCDACPGRRLGVCGAAGDEGVRRFAEAATRTDVGARALVFAEGDDRRELFSVVEGVVKLYKSLPDGRQQVLGFAMPGSVLGMEPGPAMGHSAAAVTPVRVCRVDRRRFDRLLEAFPPMERRLRQVACAELEAARDHLLTLGQKTAQERVATFLLNLLRGRTGPAAGWVFLPMLRSDIADHLGLRLETVSRVLSGFARAGLVRQEGQHVLRCLNPRRLAAIAGGEAHHGPGLPEKKRAVL